MDFGDAIRALKNDMYVARAGWNGKNMYLYLLGEQNQFGMPTLEPCICMYTAQGKHQPGWVASQSDMLADDWDIVGGR